MGVIKKFNPETGEWEIYGSTEAKDINLIDVENNFSNKNVEGALREISNKLSETTANLKAHSATLVEHTSNIAWLKENGGGGGTGGGGGGTASAPTITSSFEDGTIVTKEEEVKIPIFFTSPNLGEGTAYVMIDNIEVAIISGIKQGNNTIDIGRLTNLRNVVSIYVKDRTGMLSNQLTWTIIAGGIDLEVLFDDTADYYITDIIYMQYNVTSASTEPIMMHMTIDYDEIEFECDSGFNEYEFPELGIGIHKVSFYLTSGPYSTPVQEYNIVIVSSNSLYVSSSFKGGSFTIGTPIPIQYRISKASKEEFTVNMYLNNRLEKVSICTPGTYYWTLNDLDVDSYNVKIEIIGQYDEPQTLELEFNVIASGYNPLKIIESGLQYRLSARGRTNQDYDREFPVDDSGNGVTATLHNFNFFTNGWIDDELVCDGNAYVEIDFKPWENNAIYGSTIEVQYTSLDIGLTDARIFDYTDVDAPYKGVYIDIEESTMSSLAQPGKVDVDKDVETTLTFVIDRRNKFGKIYVNGICSRAFFLSDTGSGTNAVREDFTHSQKIYLNSKKGISNFGACKIKDVRVYGRVLTDDEIVQNYIAQVRDMGQQEKLYNFNYNNTTLPVIRMYGDTSKMTLETPVNMRIRYTSPNEDLYGQSFDLPYCQVNWQGTSSLQYVLKNFTARLRDENMATYNYNPYPNGIEEDVFCFKADYMESTHSRNVGIAKFVNECLYDTKNPLQLQNSKIRNSINGFPCLMYINDELQGVYNFNLDRYSTKSFGYTDEEKILVYEVSANSDTTAGAFFEWSELSGKDELSYYKSDFTCLYPPTRAAGNDNMSELIRLIKWVNNSSDEDFRDNFENYFNKEYVLRYYLFVLVFGAVDSLGKNMKLASFDGGLTWYPQVYDADTTIGLDNTGFLKFDMDIEMGDENTFNTTGSMLWKRVVELFQEELKTQYSLMRQDRFTVDNIMKYLYDEQIAKIPAVYYNKDMQTKYLNFGSSYLYALHGNGEQHIKKWIRERIIYVDSLLGYMVDFDKDKITLRSSKLGEVYLDIETYIPMYVTVKWRNEANNAGMQTKRVGRGKTVRFTYNMPTATDQEIFVYAGYYLKRLGNVSNLEPTTMLIANASRLTEIECHSPNLINTDLSECTKLQRIDLSNSTALGSGIGAQPTLNISNCKYLRYCNCSNTKLTAIYTMQAGGNLEEIYYPDTTQVIQLSNQTYLRVVGIPFGSTYCRSLADVDISNCHKIEYIHYPFIEGESLNFESMKYVQNLKLSNSLDKLKILNFRGFNKLTTVELSSMHNIEVLGFDDMLQVVDTPYLSRFVASDCPRISEITFNVSGNDYKIAFAEDSTVDLSGMQSVNLITGNYPIKGLKTLIIPNSTKNLLFNYKFGDGQTDIKNIWSGLVNHSNDGYEGIDLKGVELENITMDAFEHIVNGKNFSVSPTNINPFFNINRDGVEKPFFRPEGKINLSKYTGSMEYMFKGMDLTKFNIVIEGNRPQQVLTNLFEQARIVSTDTIKSKDLINGILSAYPYADVWDGLFRYADIDFDTDDIIIPDKYISTADMYRGTSITKDIDIPYTMINVDSMFRDCKQLKNYLENWNKNAEYYDPDMITRGCYFNSGGDLELVPPEWGGYGFYPEVTSEIIVDIPYENYTLQLCNRYTTLSIGVASWGDGEVTFLEEDGYSHVYKQPGKYTIKGHFTFGPGTESRENTSYFSPEESLRNALIEVVYLAQDTTDLYQAFKYCRNLRKVNIGNLHISNLGETFSGCTMLSDLRYPASTFNELKEIHGLFSGCELLTSIDLSNFRTENITNFSNMFSGCLSLTDIDVSGLNTGKAENISGMFKNCESLVSLDLSNFVTDKVTNMSNMFNRCISLEQLNISSFNTKEVTTMQGMFARTGLIELDLSHFNTEKVTTMFEMFSNMERLTSLNISSFNTKQVTTMEEMFYRCTSLKSLDLTNFDMSNVTNIMYMFSGDGELEELKFDIFDVRKVLDMKYLFSGCSKLTELNMENFMIEAATNIESMFINCNSLTSLRFPKFNTKNVTTMRDIFSGCRSLTSIDVSNFDTSNCEDFGGIFYYCPTLTEIDVSNWNTKKAKRMDNMFKYCRNITSLDLYNFDTSSLENMDEMFFECYNIEHIKLTSFVSTNIRNARALFSYCQKLQTVDFGQLEFNLVSDMSSMFNGCYTIEEIDLSKFNTFSVNNMNNMFSGCNALNKLILGDKFSTKYVTDFNNMFSGTFNLIDFNIDNFDFSSATNLERMFENCGFNVNMANQDLSNVTNMSRMFKEYKGTSIDMTNCNVINSKDNIEFIYASSSLTDFVPPINISSSIHVNANLTVDTFITLINNLVEVEEPQMLVIGDSNINKIPDNIIAEAISKNWSVA